MCKLHVLIGMAMTLREYLAAKQLSQAECAAALAVSPSEVSLWLKAERGESGGRRPGLENATKIHEWSGGEVPAKSWIRKPPAKSRRAHPRRAARTIRRR
jgi:transcriptional regulator with XRE-family HTH domain